MATPRVALVHDHLTQDGGAEQVLRVLMRMYPKAPVYTAFFDPQKMGPDFVGRDIRPSFLDKIPLVRRYYKWPLVLLDTAFRRFDLSEYDIVISDASAWAKSVRTRPETLHLCYCHTPTRYLWSDHDQYVSELGYPAPIKAAIRLVTPLLRRKDLRAAAGVDRFVANSRYVAERIKRYYKRDSEVINPPVAVEQFKPSAKTADYFLVAGRLVPYKRVDLVIEAANQHGLPLKIIGTGVDQARLKSLAGPTVEFTGRVPDAERRKLFAGAKAFVNPQDEDFGITVVEALASGTPVIAYALGGASEILEPDTGVLVPEQSADAFAKAMQSFDRSKFSAQKLRQRAERFSEPSFRKKLKSFVDRAYREADANRR